MAVAVERAAESVTLTGARHRGHADVGGQFDELSAETATEADIVGEAVPLLGIADEVGVALCACARGCPVVIVEDDRGGNVLIRHGERIAASYILTFQRHIVTVGVSDGDARHRARCNAERDDIVWVRRLVICRNSAWPSGVDGDSVGMLKGITIHIFAVGGVVFVLIERVIQMLLTIRVLVARPFIVIPHTWLYCQVAVERAVLDVAAPVVAARDAAHAIVLVRHVGRHAAVFDGATVVLAHDAAHFGQARASPAGVHMAADPAVADGAVVLATDAAH